ncbi:MAG TPA: methyl-accepting chemotaxis protein [Bryobacteraceae bacterium]|nr:methyl-accepting chemotaxis protein [Bryobacteraceae bacterium]
MLRRLRLSTRIAFIGIITTFCFSCALVWIHTRIRTVYYDAKYETLAKVVESAWNAVDYYGKQAQAGKMTLPQAQQAAQRTVRAIRWGPAFNEAFWINDLEPRMLMNTSSPALEGQMLAEKTDPNGIHIFLEMVKVSRNQGAGRVEYMWPRENGAVPVRKINYVKLYEPWGWVIGTGMYVDDVESELRRLAFVFFGVAALAAGLALLLTYFVVRTVSHPIQTIAAELAEVANQVTSAAAQVSTASQTLAQDASSEASALEQSSASAGQISAMARKNEEDSKGSAAYTLKTSEVVADANHRLDEMTKSMAEINSSSGKIAKIIKVIDEIAFQTNILALNAAVEAARAGEAGMGFAVVADEVRTLSQRCAKAAQDTTSLIEDSIVRTKDGTAKLDQVTQSIGEITGSAAGLRQLIDGVHASSSTQAQSIDQIAQALANMGSLTQRTAANAEQSAAASEELSAQAESMRASVRRLEGLVAGQK